MANHHGTEGAVKVAANTVAELLGFTLSESAEFAEDTTLADTTKTRNNTAIDDASGTMTCNWDETDTNGQEAMSIGSEVTLNLYPEGSATGATYWTGTVLINDVGLAVERGGITERTFGFVAKGDQSWTTV